MKLCGLLLRNTKTVARRNYVGASSLIICELRISWCVPNTCIFIFMFVKRLLRVHLPWRGALRPAGTSQSLWSRAVWPELQPSFPASAERWSSVKKKLVSEVPRSSLQFLFSNSVRLEMQTMFSVKNIMDWEITMYNLWEKCALLQVLINTPRLFHGPNHCSSRNKLWSVIDIPCYVTSLQKNSGCGSCMRFDISGTY